MSNTQDYQGKAVVPCWINGKALPLDNSQLIEVNSSAQGKVVHYAHSATVDIAKNAVEVAAEAFKTWSEEICSVRRTILMKAADNLESRMKELMQYQIEETSCPEFWAQFNVVLAAKAIREIAANITTSCAGEMPTPETKNGFCLVYKQAIGTVLSIAPWNGSIVLSSRALAAPLAAGCTVVFKASELSPRTHMGVTQAFLDAGLPPGALNQIQVNRENASEVTETIISHPAIRKIEFIGSAAIGRVIGQLAAKYLKPVLMELGGKCPAIVLKDADLKRAAMLCAQGATMHHGQVCMSTERIIVVEDVAKEFIQCLNEAVATMQGNAGYAVSQNMAQKAQKLISVAKDNGATLLIGKNENHGDSGAALEPTFITDVKKENPIRDLETFGPSASVYVVKDQQEAIEVANDSAYGLSGAIHTKDMLNGLKVAKALEVGLVAINDVTLWDEATAPIGGVKGSGWGNNNAKFGIEEFLIKKAVAIIDPTAGPAN